MRVVVGAIPETLPQVESSVAYLHLDMNCAPPEVAAADYFWDLRLPGATVLLDDYAYVWCEPQKTAMDPFASAMGHRDLLAANRPGLDGQATRKRPA